MRVWVFQGVRVRLHVCHGMRSCVRGCEGCHDTPGPFLPALHQQAVTWRELWRRPEDEDVTTLQPSREFSLHLSQCEGEGPVNALELQLCTQAPHALLSTRQPLPCSLLFSPLPSAPSRCFSPIPSPPLLSRPCSAISPLLPTSHLSHTPNPPHLSTPLPLTLPVSRAPRVGASTYGRRLTPSVSTVSSLVP